MSALKAVLKQLKNKQIVITTENDRQKYDVRILTNGDRQLVLRFNKTLTVIVTQLSTTELEVELRGSVLDKFDELANVLRSFFQNVTCMRSYWSGPSFQTRIYKVIT